MIAGNKRGRPSKRQRGTEAVKELCADVVVRQHTDERGRLRAPIVEIAPRDQKNDIGTEEKILFLRVCAAIRRNQDIRVRVGSEWKFPSAIELAANLCDISQRTAWQLHSDFQRDREIPSCSQRGAYARTLELEKLFAPRLLYGWIRNIVVQNTARNVRSNFWQITADLQDYVRSLLLDKMLGDQPSVSEENLKTAITYKRVRSWCLRNGYKNNLLKNKKRSTLVDDAKTRALASQFAEAFVARADRPETVFIGLDESYVDEHHARAYGVCNVVDAETVPSATKKGRRICICDAIATTADLRTSGELTQLDPDRERNQRVRWTFRPNPHITPSKRKSDSPVDYHKSFDNENFLMWFMNDMIPAAERAFPGKSLTIIMDNASYHKYSTFVVREHAADGSETTTRVKRDSRKELLVKFIQNHRGLESASMSVLKPVLISTFDDIVAEMGSDAERFCRNRTPIAHEILFTPPRYSEWQPIEMLWAAAKNEVASKWSAGRGLNVAEQQMHDALERWGSPDHLAGQNISHCGKLWRKCIGLIRSHLDHLRDADAQGEVVHVSSPADSSSNSVDDSEDGVVNMEEYSSDEGE
jgi:hypothetical protein